MTSFAPARDYYNRGFFLIPSSWTLEAYRYLLHNSGFLQAFKSSVLITAVGTLINVMMTSMMAYGLSESWIKGRSAVNFLILFTMLFSGGLIPTYLVVDGLHLIDTYWALWLPAAIAPFNVIVMRSFFSSLPYELKESARIDGCGRVADACDRNPSFGEACACHVYLILYGRELEHLFFGRHLFKRRFEMAAASFLKTNVDSGRRENRSVERSVIFVHTGCTYGGDTSYGIAFAGHLSVPSKAFQ